MSNVADALAGFKTILAGIDPTPQPVPAAIYHWEVDYDSMDYTVFPFIIVAHNIEEDGIWQPAATGVGWHLWVADILICLANGPLTRKEVAASAEAKQVPWLLATAKILFNNQGVNGTVTNIGVGEALSTYKIGHLGWDNHEFWGIRFKVPVRQEHSLPSF